MTTYSTTGVSFGFDANDQVTNFTTGIDFSAVFPDGQNTFTYTVDVPAGTGDSDIDEVTINSAAFNFRINGINETSYNGGLGTEANIGQIEWDDGGGMKTTYILDFFDPSTELEYLFIIGGDPLPAAAIASAAGLNSFLANDVTSIDSAAPGSGFDEGDAISLATIPGVVISENDTIVGTDGDDNLDGGVGDDNISPGENNGYDLISGSVGNDTIDFTTQLDGNSYTELNYNNLNSGIIFTINGVTNTGTVNKGVNGTDTIINIANPLNNGWINGGLGTYGTDHDDVFNITTGNDQWNQVGGGAGNDTFNITQSGNGVTRIDYSRAGSGINVNLVTGVVSDDGDGGMDTINGDVWEIRGSNFTDTIVGSDNDESFIGRSGDDTIDGGDGYDRIRYDRSGVDSGIVANLTTGIITGSWNGSTFTHTVSNFEYLRGSKFADMITGSDADERLEGRDGNDTINGGLGSDEINGGGGDDTLNAGDNLGGVFDRDGFEEFDLLIGSTGNDEYIFTQALNGFHFLTYNYVGLAAGIGVTINGVNNTGTITKGAAGTDTLTDIKTTLDAAFNTNTGGFGMAGSQFNDTFHITNTPTLPMDNSGQWISIRGDEGVDTYTIVSGLVRLDFRGGQGANVDLSTNTVNNDGHGNMESITGTVWELRGGEFDDVFVGSAADESFIGQLGSDDIDGGDGFDRLRFDRNGAEIVTVDLEAGSATGTWSGSTFTYTISNIEWVRGTYNGHDVIRGNDLANLFEGFGGNDILEGRGGADTLDGGDGSDTASYESSTSRVVVDLSGGGSASEGDAEGDTLISIENLIGSDHNDRFTGGSDVNVFDGGAGNDNMNGGAGNDTINGGDGEDIINGGNNDDILNGNNDNDTIYGNGQNDTINGGQGEDIIFGGSGSDTINGGSEDDELNGQGQADEINGGGGEDLIRGGSGDDIINGGADRDIIFGNGNNDTINGGGGNDSIQGASGSDTLFGNGGDDTLTGGTGGDRLDGGTGNDTMNGGVNDGARDIFVFKVGYDEDRINAFDQVGNDRLELDDALWLADEGVLTAQEVVDTFGSVNGNSTILTLDFGNGDILEIQNAGGIDAMTLGSDIVII